MKVGFIGTGSMGSLLIQSFIHSNALKPQQISASNRTHSKVTELARRYPGLHAVQSNRETAAESDVLFICVKPLESKAVTDEIRNVITEEQIVVSITSPVQIRILEHALKAKVSKIIPSITHQVGSGASLCIHGSRITEEDRFLLEELMSHISSARFGLKNLILGSRRIFRVAVLLSWYFYGPVDSSRSSSYRYGPYGAMRSGR